MVAVTKRDQQQLDLSSMESVMDQDTHPSQFVFLKMGTAVFSFFLNYINNVIEGFRREGKIHPVVQVSHLAFGAATRTLSRALCLPG